MISLHFPLLLLAAFLPYATTVVGHYPDNPLDDRPPVSGRRSRASRNGVWYPKSER
jgi:hypothetical protein